MDFFKYRNLRKISSNVNRATRNGKVQQCRKMTRCVCVHFRAYIFRETQIVISSSIEAEAGVENSDLEN